MRNCEFVSEAQWCSRGLIIDVVNSPDEVESEVEVEVSHHIFSIY